MYFCPVMYIKLPKKIYYSIGEIAKAFQVNTSLIRFWEKKFTVLSPKKNKKGDRMFSEKDLTHFKIIYHLVKEKGYTLEGAKKSLHNFELEKNIEIITRLEYIKSELLSIKLDLDENIQNK